MWLTCGSFTGAWNVGLDRLNTNKPELKRCHNEWNVNYLELSKCSLKKRQKMKTSTHVCTECHSKSLKSTHLWCISSPGDLIFPCHIPWPLAIFTVGDNDTFMWVSDIWPCALYPGTLVQYCFSLFKITFFFLRMVYCSHNKFIFPNLTRMLSEAQITRKENSPSTSHVFHYLSCLSLHLWRTPLSQWFSS